MPSNLLTPWGLPSNPLTLRGGQCSARRTSPAVCGASPTKSSNTTGVRVTSSWSGSRAAGSGCGVIHLALRRLAERASNHLRQGSDLAERLAALISEVEGAVIPVGALDITMYRDDLRHQPTRPPMMTVIPPGGIEGKVVVLVDDVLYSGRTVRAALDALSEYGRPKAVRLAVLVDRGHRELPIRADHVGKNLPTSHAEKVQVRLAANDGVEDIVRIAGGEAR